MRPLRALLAAALLGCTSTPTAPPSGELSLDRDSYPPFAPVIVTLPESLLGAEPAATIAGRAVGLTRLDGASFGFVLPELPAGEHELEVRAGGATGAAKVRVTAPPAVAVDDEIAGFEETLAARIEALGEAGRRLADRLQEARGTIASLSAAERARLATFLAVNRDRLRFDPYDASLDTPGGQPLSAGTCVATSATREAAVSCIDRRLKVRLAALVISTLVTLEVPVAAAVVAGVQLVSMSRWLTDEFAAGLVQQGSLLEQPEKSSRRTLEVAVNQELVVPLASTYRPLGPGDAQADARFGLLLSITGLVAKFEAIWARVAAIVGLEEQPYALGDGTSEVRRVPSTFVQIANVSAPAGLALEASLEGDSLRVKAIGAVSDEPRTCTFDLRYANPEVSEATTTVELVVVPACPDGVTVCAEGEVCHACGERWTCVVEGTACTPGSVESCSGGTRGCSTDCRWGPCGGRRVVCGGRLCQPEHCVNDWCSCSIQTVACAGGRVGYTGGCGTGDPLERPTNCNWGADGRLVASADDPAFQQGVTCLPPKRCATLSWNFCLLPDQVECVAEGARVCEAGEQCVATTPGGIPNCCPAD